MQLKADHRVAAGRHFSDARILEDSEESGANADHLYGIAAECALKAVMIALGAAVNRSGLSEGYKVHINELWNQYSSFVAGRNASNYSLGNSQPFKDWHVDQRYESGERVTPLILARHREASELAMQLLGQAVLDGMVP